MKRWQLAVTALAFSATLAACSKTISDDQQVTENRTSTGVGPFDLKPSTETGPAMQNSFSADINQEDGAVDFFNPGTTNTQYLVLENYTATVRGCNATTVKVTPVWYSSESSTNPSILLKGYTMTTTPSVRGKLRFVFEGMKGCTHLDFSMVVRKLEIGALQSTLESRLIGSWSYGTAPALTIDLFISSTRVGWLEGQGTTYTCDTQMFPKNAIETNGGWIVNGSGTLLCHYQFDTTSSMMMNCYGTNLYRCTVPKNLRFLKH